MKRALLLALLLTAGCGNAAPGTAYERGVAALRSGDAATARVELLNAIKADPTSETVRIMQARAYIALGDGVAAQAEVERARVLGAPVSATRALMAHALILQQQPAEALAALGSLPGAYADRLRGGALALLGRAGEAARAYDRALAQAPDDAKLWTDVARFRRANGEIAGALQAADRALTADPENVEAISLRGELTRGQYGLSAALPWFDRAIALDEDYVVARLERAATLGELGDMAGMLSETRRVLARSPDNALAYYFQALLAARAGNFPLARSVYQRTQGKVDGQPAAMLLSGAIAFGTRDAEGAVEKLEALIALQPGNLKARRLLAAAQLAAGQARDAVTTLRPLADQPDADSYVLNLMGGALVRLGDHGAAAAYLARASLPPGGSGRPGLLPNDDPDSLAALREEAAAARGDVTRQVRLIRALIAAGMTGEALERATLLQAVNPGAPDAHLLVGDALEAQGQLGGALANYRKAANIAFTEPAAMRMIGALERMGQGGAATRVLNLYLEQNPRSVPAQRLAAARFVQLKRWHDAAETYERLRTQIGDGDAVLLNNLALAYAELGDYPTAIRRAERAWRLDRNNPITTDTLGWLLFKSGADRSRGLVLLQRASRGGNNEAAIKAALDAAYPTAARRRT